jgi:hypothetical protein
MVRLSDSPAYVKGPLRLAGRALLLIALLGVYGLISSPHIDAFHDRADFVAFNGSVVSVHQQNKKSGVSTYFMLAGSSCKFSTQSFRYGASNLPTLASKIEVVVLATKNKSPCEVRPIWGLTIDGKRLQSLEEGIADRKQDYVLLIAVTVGALMLAAALMHWGRERTVPSALTTNEA